MKLADFAYKSFNDRRGHEWKFLFALWGTVLFVTHNELKFFDGIPDSAIWLTAFFAIPIICLSWIQGCWAANQSDKDQYDDLIRSAYWTISPIGRPKKTNAYLNNKCFLLNWSNFLQVVITVIVILSAALAITSNREKPKKRTTPNFTIEINLNLKDSSKAKRCSPQTGSP